jgi:hypothetical protein
MHTSGSTTSSKPIPTRIGTKTRKCRWPRARAGCHTPTCSRRSSSGGGEARAAEPLTRSFVVQRDQLILRRFARAVARFASCHASRCARSNPCLRSAMPRRRLAGVLSALRPDAASCERRCRAALCESEVIYGVPKVAAISYACCKRSVVTSLPLWVGVGQTVDLHHGRGQSERGERTRR